MSSRLDYQSNLVDPTADRIVETNKKESWRTMGLMRRDLRCDNFETIHTEYGQTNMAPEE